MLRVTSARTHSIALLLGLAACGTAPRPVAFAADEAPPAVDASPAAAAAAARRQEEAQDKVTLPIGIGFSSSPTTFLIGGSADYRLDNHLTAGPALQIGFGDDTIFAPFAQVRYWLNDLHEGGATFSPYLQGGVGAVYLDRERRSSDWGPLVNVGGGVRILTGDQYRLGSTALLNFMPGDVAGDSFYFTWEIAQLVLEF